MEQPRNASRGAQRRMTREEWEAQRRRRRRLRLARNWALLLSGCTCAVLVAVFGVPRLLLSAQALVAEPETFEAVNYDGSSYVFDSSDQRLELINSNLPLGGEPSPELAVADDSTGVQLEVEAAAAYRRMAAAASEAGVSLVLKAGYQSAGEREAAFEAQKQAYIAKGLSDDEAASRAATIVPRPECSEYATGYAADILSNDYTAADTGFASTRAYEWLCAYAAEYGFVLRCPEDRQAATGMVYEPWHWRYVGAENALALRSSGLSLEEFLAVELAGQ